MASLFFLMKQQMLAIDGHLLAEFLGKRFHTMSAQQYGILFQPSYISRRVEIPLCHITTVTQKTDNKLNATNGD